MYAHTQTLSVLALVAAVTLVAGSMVGPLGLLQQADAAKDEMICDDNQKDEQTLGGGGEIPQGGDQDVSGNNNNVNQQNVNDNDGIVVQDNDYCIITNPLWT